MFSTKPTYHPSGRRLSLLVVLAGTLTVATALSMSLFAGSTNAATCPPTCGSLFTVTNTNDDSSIGSLRQKIADANSGDTIDFSPTLTGNTITLDSAKGPLVINKNLTIDGGNTSITISGNNSVPVFSVTTGVVLDLNNLTVADGNVDSLSQGGGISNSGTLTVSNSTFSNNHSLHYGGGGIYNSNTGTLTVNNSTFSNNSAIYFGGGIYNPGGEVTVSNSTFFGNSTTSSSSGAGGGIANSGTLTVSNSTFSNNSAFSGGGGIYNFNTATLTVSNSTFSNNSASKDGGAINNNGTATLLNTIVAKGTSGGNCFGTITDDGYNLDEGTTCGFFKPTSKNSTNPLLDPSDLKDNGGPTKTIALLPTSPAIDKGNASGSNTDQRGLPRPSDFATIPPATGSDDSDIGAFELQSSPPPPPPPPHKKKKHKKHHHH